ncbi:hypothetical protein QM716_28425 [Rhodococcus sp. IEGM 1409]|uniref:hypothetical protein n=1 Tax=Rhodococcus sp. IEGM 1409 TaxID=3047082 RepID=UPI0024B79D65|nr:hypothetical protein [Rhodococcus sp. IEGM 1409]MDI9903796.1 hypothetical protein [Rhodococcus sp. IEGM 1409]
MRNPSKSLFTIAPAALDPFGQFGNRAARRHPRRNPDPQGHPQSPAGTPPAPAVDPGTPPAATPPAATPPAAPAPDDWATTFEGLTPAEVKTQLDNSRRWETRAKANHPKAEKYDQILAGLTGGSDPATPPDPAAIATSLTAAQQDARDTKVENAILRLAPGAAANANSLIDSRSFMDKIKSLDLDPTASDFTAKMTAEIQAAITTNPGFKIVAPVGVGVVVPGEGNSPENLPDIDAQIAAATKAGDIQAAMRLKSQKLHAASK